MKIELQTKITKTDLLILPFYSGEKLPQNQKEALGEHGYPDFEGKPNETLLLYQKNKLTPRLLLVGLGKKSDETTDTWRQAGGTVTQYFKKPIQTITIVPPKEWTGGIVAFIEGMQLGHYQYETWINDEDRKLQKIDSTRLIFQDKGGKANLETELKNICVVTEAVNHVRDMVTAPSNKMSPSVMAEEARKIAKRSRKMSCKIFDEKSLIKMKMGCLVGVGNGAHEKPKFIVLEYKHRPKNKKPIVLIGKGICFDAGGLNIKTQNLTEMKYDMTGAATVLGVMEIIARLQPEAHVIALAPCAENLVGEKATKPSDILTAYDGTTVEITNTDAEGRLVLCDAIAYAVKNHKPEAIVDVATLTGAAIIALGYDLTALMTNDKKLGDRIKKAAESTDESLWEMPMVETYKKHLKSSIADVANYSPKPSAGTIMGGLFLEYFTKGTPWAHLDMGGSAWTNDPQPYYPKGATGRNVRTLWQLIKNY